MASRARHVETPKRGSAMSESSGVKWRLLVKKREEMAIGTCAHHHRRKQREIRAILLKCACC